MSWEKEIEELRRREALAQQMGGPDKVKRQHDGGKLAVRERLARLLDPGSFHEIGGLAGALHQNSSRYGMRVAWPSAEWGSLPIAGGLEAAYKADIEGAPDPAAKRAEIESRIRKFASPLRGAERFDIEEIIDPRHSRRILCEFAELAAPLRTPGRSSFGVRP